jgi:hypothetical protein
MTLRVKTGVLEVIESTSFLAYGLGETEVCLGAAGPEQLRFVFTFESNVDNKDPGLSYEGIDDHAVRIRLTNWNNNLGISLVEPQEMGSFQKQKLFLAFAVTKVGSKGEVRHITLTFYAGEAVSDG